MAGQHTLTSYRCPGFRPWRKNHDWAPCGASCVGNDAFSKVRRVGESEDNRSRPRSSKAGLSRGTGFGGGAIKMIFSTFARAEISSRKEKSRTKKSCILPLILPPVLVVGKHVLSTLLNIPRLDRDYIPKAVQLMTWKWHTLSAIVWWTCWFQMKDSEHEAIIIWYFSAKRDAGSCLTAWCLGLPGSAWVQ